jgi:ATP-dependent Lon protease
MSTEVSMIEKLKLPTLPIKDMVIFPHMVIPLFVGRESSTRAIEEAMISGKNLFVVAQKKEATENIRLEDFYLTGTIVNVLQLLRMPDGTIKILVEGSRRANVMRYLFEDECYYAEVLSSEEVLLDTKTSETLQRTLLSEFEQYIRLNSHLPIELISTLTNITELGRLVDMISAHMPLKLEQKQLILELADQVERTKKLIGFIQSEIELLEVEDKIRSQVKEQMEKHQREYYLNEQMKAIQKELSNADGQSDLDKLEEEIKTKGLSEQAKTKAEGELKKLRSMTPMAAEYTVSRNYLDYLLALPWKKKSKLQYDLQKAVEVLEAEHYGLQEVKERIIEYLAVMQRVKKIKGAILCLVGPPGVGKTSLGRSIAKATGREYTRFSLGGVRDEAEIRGHRKTYIGAMPGKILQSLSKVKVGNPLFLLDEIDKMAMDFRGDPASALLEVLDPEQNNTFNDHYLDVDYDLSEVMFVCTANSLNIPGPLLDRMEIIRIPGYTEDEKVHIAKNHLLLKQFKENGLKMEEVHISGGTIRSIIRYYTREAGVRNLERNIAKICRKVVTEILTQKDKEKILVTQRNVEKYLGVKKFRFGIADESNRVGEVTGLAWTEVGGELLSIEAAVMSGKGSITSTGHLGEVMQESIKAAFSVVRARAATLGLEEDFYQKKDIHIHVPEGATPKDGPSAGIAMCTAFVSSLTGIPVRADVAMTGEITLRGEVLPIGGLKEKLLAAHRGGIKEVIIPIENEKDLKEIPNNIKADLNIHPLRWIDEVLKIALERDPFKKIKQKPKKTAASAKQKKLKKPLKKAKKT